MSEEELLFDLFLFETDFITLLMCMTNFAFKTLFKVNILPFLINEVFQQLATACDI